MKIKEFIKFIKYAEDLYFDVFKNNHFVLISADVEELLDKCGNEEIQVNSIKIHGDNVQIDL